MGLSLESIAGPRSWLELPPALGTWEPLLHGRNEGHDLGVSRTNGGFPKSWKLQNGWFTRDNIMTMEEDWGYQYFRKLPNGHFQSHGGTPSRHHSFH